MHRFGTVMISLVLAFALAGAAYADDVSVELTLTERASQLVDVVNDEGIAEVARSSDLDERDLQLLKLMAALNVRGAIDARAIIERRLSTAADARRFSISGDWLGESMTTATYNEFRALRAGANRDIDVSDYYVVFIENQSSVRFDEIVIFYQVRGDSMIKMTNVLNLHPASVHMFTLGYCSEFVSYAIGVFIGGQLVAKQPTDNSQGLTPADVARMHPWDNNPCKDFWGIGK